MENEEIEKVQTRSSKIRTVDIKNIKETTESTSQNTNTAKTNQLQKFNQNIKSKDNKNSDVRNKNIQEIEVREQTVEMSEDNETIYNMISMANVEKTIPVFEGDTGMAIDMWIKNFEDYAVAYGWTEIQKFVFARNKMKKCAELFLQSVSVCDYNTLKKLLIEEFHKNYTSAEIHSQLRERKKKDSENIQEYVLHMRQIGSLGMVDERSIIRYIVDGIKGSPEGKIGLYSARNYKELREQML